MIVALVAYAGWAMQILWSDVMAIPARKFDAVIVGAGGAGMRASLQLAEAGLQGRGAVQGLSDALAHGGRAGRHRRLARQHEARTLALAHVRHGQGVGLPGRPGRDRVHRARRRRCVVCELEHLRACRSTGHPTARIYQRLFGGHTKNFGKGGPSCAPATRPTAPGTRMLHTLYQRNVRANTQFFVEWMALDLIRDAAGRRAGRDRAGDGNRRGHILQARATLFATGGAGRIFAASTNASSTPATAWAWRRAPASRWRTWNSGSSTRPAWTAPAC